MPVLAGNKQHPYLIILNMIKKQTKRVTDWHKHIYIRIYKQCVLIYSTVSTVKIYIHMSVVIFLMACFILFVLCYTMVINYLLGVSAYKWP